MRILTRVIQVVFWLLFALCVATVIGALSLRYAVFPHLELWRLPVQQALSRITHAQVHIGVLQGQWRGLQPCVVVQAFTLRDQKGQLVLEAPRIEATFSWRTLPKGKLIFSDICIDNPHAILTKTAKGGVRIGDFLIPAFALTDFSKSSSSKIAPLAFLEKDLSNLRTLFDQEALQIRNGHIELQESRYGIKDIQFAIFNQGRRHQVGLQANLIEGTRRTSSMDMRLHFQHRFWSQVTDPAAWMGQGYLSVSALSLPVLTPLLNIPIHVSEGTLNARNWFAFKKGHFRKIEGHVHIDKAHGSAQNNTRSDVKIPRLSFAYNLSHRPSFFSIQHPSQRYSGLFAIQLRDLFIELETRNGRRHFQSALMKMAYQTPQHQNSGRLTLEGDTLDLDFLSACIRYIRSIGPFLSAPSARDSKLESSFRIPDWMPIDMHGRLSNYLLDMAYPLCPAMQSCRSLTFLPQRFERPLQKQYRIKADFDQLTLLSHSGAPLGVKHLSGSIDANESNGTLILNTRDSAVSVPKVLSVPTLEFDVLKGKIEWSLAPIQSNYLIKLNVAPLTFSNKEGAGKINAMYQKQIKLPLALSKIIGRQVYYNVPVDQRGVDKTGSKGILNLSMSLDRALLAAIPRYLPSALDQGLRQYLAHALQGGVTQRATLEINGALDNFPFGSAHPGVFKVKAPFYRGRFDPSVPVSSNKTHWPALEELEGVFEIDQDVLNIALKQGRYQDIKITQAQGKIAHLSKQVDDFLIEVKASGPLNTILDYVKHSPIPSWTGHVTDWFAATGPANLALRLTLPRQGSKQLGVEGAVTFSGNTVSAQIPDESTKPHATKTSQSDSVYLLPTLTQLSGVMQFTDHSLTFKPTAARWRGAPLSYQLALQFSSEGSLTGMLHADLTELPLNWPAPFNKSKRQPMHLHVSVEDSEKVNVNLHSKSSKNKVTDSLNKRVDIELGPLLAAYHLSKAASSSEYKVVSGALRLDTLAFSSSADVQASKKERFAEREPPRLKLPNQGVAAFLRVDQFDSDAWRRALATISMPQRAVSSDTQHSGGRSPYWPTKLSAQVGTWIAGQRAWHAVSLDAAYRDGVWHGTTSAKEFAGQLSWTPPARSKPLHRAVETDNHEIDHGSLKGHFSRLTLPSLADLVSVTKPSVPIQKPLPHTADLHLKDGPALDVQIDHLNSQGKELGQLAIKTRSTAVKGQPVWELEKFQIANSDAVFNATGQWMPTERAFGNKVVSDIDHKDPGHSAFRFDIEFKNAGTLLERFGIPKILQGGIGTIKSQIQWRGSPEQVSYDSLTGEITLDLKNGQLLKAEPGVGSLLGALSLQSLVHLLFLDFRYLPGRGLAFDSAKGTAVIQNGVAYIDDLIIDSTLAYIKLTGSAELANRQQNFMLNIQPSINAGSAVLAATVFNPVLGLGSYIAQQVLSASLAHKFLLYYAISGSWDNPIIERVQADTLTQKAPNLNTEAAISSTRSISTSNTQDHEK